jgi:hypothetical protein
MTAGLLTLDPDAWCVIQLRGRQLSSIGSLSSNPHTRYSDLPRPNALIAEITLEEHEKQNGRVDRL